MRPGAARRSIHRSIPAHPHALRIHATTCLAVPSPLVLPCSLAQPNRVILSLSLSFSLSPIISADLVLSLISSSSPSLAFPPSAATLLLLLLLPSACSSPCDCQEEVAPARRVRLASELISIVTAAQELRACSSNNPCMDGKELISPSDLPPFYGQHRMLAGAGGGGHGHSPSPLSGMHSVIRPMPNMSMSPTAILQSIGGGSLAGMQQFHQMDAAPPPPSPSLMHNTMGSINSGSGSATMPAAAPPQPVKRKRGRPRKYGPDGAMKVSSAAAQQQQMMSAPSRMGSMSGHDMVGSSGMEDSAQKKRRGRPPGTGKKLSSPVGKLSGNAFSGSAGTSFTPHIITASPSEDVAGKISAFANQSSRAVCVLSAMGFVSRVVLRHPADHASSVSRPHHASAPYQNPAIYEGLYEILSLSGSYNLNEGSQSQGDGLSVTLCSPERHVIGGVLGGALVAASTVQVVLGSFVHGGSKSKSKKAAKQAALGSDSLTGAQDASPSSGHNQNLTPPSVTTGGWTSSGIFDTRSSNIDINSSRG